MEHDSGLTLEGAQLAICQGTYGNKGWSETERQVACQRYEQLTGEEAQTNDTIVWLVVVIPALLFAAAYAIYKHQIKQRKTNRRGK